MAQQEQPKQYDMVLDTVIGKIYEVINQWFEKEKSNAPNGTITDVQRVQAIVNFDFGGLADVETKDHSRLVLEEIFTASETCFIPNRMKLIVSQINERFGYEISKILQDRLEYSLVNVWNIDKKEAKELVAQFPCLWLIHIVQSYALFNQSLGI